MDENKPRRRWLSFSIRDLLWAMALLAMGLAWWADHSSLSVALRKAEHLAGRRLKQFDTAVYLFNHWHPDIPMSGRDGGVQLNASGGEIDYLLPWE